MRGLIDDSERFRCSSGVRVVTSLDGEVMEVIGIDQVPREIVLRLARSKFKLTVKPNQVFRMDRSGKLVPASSAPFDYPFREH